MWVLLPYDGNKLKVSYLSDEVLGDGQVVTESLKAIQMIMERASVGSSKFLI